MTQTYLSPQAITASFTSREASAAGRLRSNGVKGSLGGLVMGKPASLQRIGRSLLARFSLSIWQNFLQAYFWPGTISRVCPFTRASSCCTKEPVSVATAWPLVLYTGVVVGSPRQVGDMKKARLSKAETRVLEQFWKMGICSVREILESLPDDERVAYTTVQTLVYRLEEKGAVSKVKKIGNAQLFEPAINQSEFRSGLVRDILDLFGGSPRLLVSNLLETGTLTLRDLKALQSAAPNSKKSRRLGGKGHA